ncbi:MAG TPA: isoprenylcysteine carboxylmethyltransferase family protein [Acidisarcina sp.]
MKASEIEFKLRVWIITGLYIVGFLAPWQYLAPALRGPRTWSWLALQLVSTRWLTSQEAFIAVLIAAIAISIAGALLRLTGTAYLGADTMQASTFQTQTIVAAGPYRFIRNPLYLGAWLTAAAVSLLMPWTGALFLIVALAGFELRLVLAEESYLAGRQGEAYMRYCTEAGRFLPRLRRPSGSVAATTSPRWLESLAAEIFPAGVAISLATLGWTYDAPLLIRAIIISYGLSLVAKALLPSRAR